MDQIRTCERCKASFPLDKIKLFPYTKDKNIVVCEECCEFLKNRAKMIVAPSRTEAKTKIKAEPKPNYKTKYCSHCKYTFKVDMHKVEVLRCPYCGKTAGICEKTE